MAAIADGLVVALNTFDNPTKAATLAVAAALGAGSLLVVGALGAPGVVPIVPARGGCAVMALVFAARTVGDFEHVGAFKRRR